MSGFPLVMDRTTQTPADEKRQVVVKVLSEVKQRCFRIRPKLSFTKEGIRKPCKRGMVRSKDYSKEATDPKTNVLCSICMDSKASVKMAWTICCNRTFHSRCLLKWCQMGGDDPVCPLCRAAVPIMMLILKVKNDKGVPETTEVLGYVTHDVETPGTQRTQPADDDIKLDLVKLLKRKKKKSRAPTGP